jgi:hypothetical protein
MQEVGKCPARKQQCRAHPTQLCHVYVRANIPTGAWMFLNKKGEARVVVAVYARVRTDETNQI